MTSQSSPIRWRVGERLSASKLNLLSEKIDAPRNPFEARPRELNTFLPRIFQVKALDDVLRTLTCTPYDMTADPNATEYIVTLPLLFYETTRGAATYTYTSLNERQQTAPVVENQEITPNLIVGDEVYCIWESRRSVWRLIMEGRMWASV